MFLDCIAANGKKSNARESTGRFFGILQVRLKTETWRDAPMKLATIAGLLLIVLGIAGFAVGDVSFTHEKQDAKVGPLEIDHQSTSTVPIPPVLSGIALAGGIALVIVGRKS